MAIYMQYTNPNIQGDVTATNYENWIEIDSFAWGVTRQVGSAQGSSKNRNSSTPSVSEITVTKKQDNSTGHLLQEAYNGVGTATVTITFVRTGSPALAYLSYILTDTMVSSLHLNSAGDRPIESLTLNFTKIEVDVIPENADGTAGSKFPVTYDLSTMTMS
jgi:type VI secretion system secreted protein Hcp